MKLRSPPEVEGIKKVNGLWFPQEEYHLLGVGRTYQQEVRKASFKYCSSFNQALDVGAHVGIWALDLAEKFREVVAFEPNPIAYECLLKNIEEYGVKNILAFNVAIGRQEKGYTKMASLGNTGNSMWVPSLDGPVQSLTLDSFHFRPNYVKLDVEGQEANVILSGFDTLRETQIVVSEEKFGDFAKAQKMLHDLGFKRVIQVSHDVIYTRRDQNGSD